MILWWGNLVEERGVTAVKGGDDKGIKNNSVPGHCSDGGSLGLLAGADFLGSVCHHF